MLRSKRQAIASKHKRQSAQEPQKQDDFQFDLSLNVSLAEFPVQDPRIRLHQPLSGM
jgi:hypothetical protein